MIKTLALVSAPTLGYLVITLIVSALASGL